MSPCSIHTKTREKKERKDEQAIDAKAESDIVRDTGHFG